jgi:pre-rRNA-processing protein IPI3
VNNILVVRQELYFNSWPNSQASSRRHGSLLPPALDKYANPIDEDANVKAIIGLQSTCRKSMDDSYLSSHVINNQIKELKVFFLLSECSLSTLLSFMCLWLHVRGYLL